MASSISPQEGKAHQKEVYFIAPSLAEVCKAGCLRWFYTWFYNVPMTLTSSQQPLFSRCLAPSGKLDHSRSVSVAIKWQEPDYLPAWVGPLGVGLCSHWISLWRGIRSGTCLLPQTVPQQLQAHERQLFSSACILLLLPAALSHLTKPGISAHRLQKGCA